jgi:paired small multidrug resistance pump
LPRIKEGVQMNRSWLMIFVASLFEVSWVVGLKYSFNWWTWLLTFVAIMISFKYLISSAKKLPIGTVYAVFTGLGTTGTVTVEMLIFGEPFRWPKLLLILLLLIGVIGLKMVTKESDPIAIKGAES